MKILKKLDMGRCDCGVGILRKTGNITNRNMSQETYLENYADVVCVDGDSEVVVEGLGCVPPGGLG